MKTLSTNKKVQSSEFTVQSLKKSIGNLSKKIPSPVRHPKGELSMVAKRFEDLIFWQKTRALTKLIYSFTNKSPFNKDFGLKEQIQRSTVSIMSNVAEGFGRGSNNEFVQFLFVAKGSLSEVKSQLYIAFDLSYLTDREFKKAYDLTEEITKLINAFIRSLKNDKKRGLKTC